MRVCVDIRDPRLGGAVEDLLRARGHEVLHGQSEPLDCELRILPEPLDEAERPSVATLYLRPAAYQQPDADPAAALKQALSTKGTAIWDSPLNTRSLLEVLAAHEGRTSAPRTAPGEAPSLEAAPHPWMVLDVGRRILVQWSPEARDLLRLPAEVSPGGLPLGKAGLPGNLRDALLTSSDGRMPLDSLGRMYIAAWWTGRAGRRIICLLQDPGGRGAPADRHLRTLAEIGRMAATLAHEIRNPVASVASALDLIADSDDADERSEIVQMARARLDDMRMLLDDTLRMARPLDQEVEPIELAALVQSALSVAGPNPGFEEIAVELDPPPESITVQAHVGPLQQALVNLLMNAAQAQDGHGKVRIQWRAEGRSAVLSVHDAGPGIPEDAMKQIFTPFYTTKSQGTGLGLAFVRRVVEAAGGAVSAEPVDTGACIRIQLPLDG